MNKFTAVALIALMVLLVLAADTVSAKETVVINAVGTNYKYNGWSHEQYPVIDLFGDKYVSLFFKSDNTLNYRVDKLATLVLDSDTNYTLKTGEKLDLGKGYTLKLKQVDDRSKLVWLEFLKDGQFIDDQIINIYGTAAEKTWTVALDNVQNEDNIVVMKVHVNQIISNASGNILQIDGIWLIDYANAKALKTDDKLGAFTLSGNYGDKLVFEFADDQLASNETTVPKLPVANFNSNHISGYAPLSVQFTDLSQNATGRNWDFENDGKVDSTDKNPVRAYTVPGKYTVKLIAFNANGTNSKLTTINILEKTNTVIPVANFNSPQADPANVDGVSLSVPPVTVSFIDSSTGSPTSWFWDFGDGNTSTAENPTHTYAEVGGYTVTLTVRNDAGSNTVSKYGYVITGMGIAVFPGHFSSDVVSGSAPLTVVFYDPSTDVINRYWSFGDGTGFFEDVQGHELTASPYVTHTYTKAGKYTVLLKVSGYGSDSIITKYRYINVTESKAPVASFTANVTSGKAPLTIKFMDVTTGKPTSWKWSFGDGINSTEQNPEHTYSTAGNYTIMFTATNSTGSNTTTKSDYIKVTEAIQKPVVNFISNVTQGSAPLSVLFTDLSQNAISRGWDFNNDGIADSSDANPVHVYTFPGTYTVNLTVGNTKGTVSKSSTVTVFPVQRIDGQLILTETQITTDPLSQEDPAIYGDRIVWTDSRNLNYYIYMYNLSTFKETQITTYPSSSQKSAIYGDRIVWLEDRNGNLVVRSDNGYDDIYMYNLSTSKETQITTNPSSSQKPAIYGDRIVWLEDRNGNWDIYMYDLSTSKETQITTTGSGKGAPAIYGDRIVWLDQHNGSEDICMYNISTSEETQITTKESGKRAPAIYGNRIVWQDLRNGNWDIYMYDLSTSKELQITTGRSDQTYPAIYDDRIVWQDGRNGNWDIYMYDLSTSKETQITTNNLGQYNPAIYGNMIVWADARNGQNDIYMCTVGNNPEDTVSINNNETSGSNSGGSSHSSSGGSSGGGGAGGSPEPATNIEVKELSQAFVTSGNSVKFDLPRNATSVLYVSFDAKKTAGKTTTIVEMLKGKSTLVSGLPSDEVYKSLNIWVGNSGFATSSNIENAVVCFKVEKSWVQDKKIDKSSIALNRYSDKKWDSLPTNLSGEDDKFLYFTAKTPGFSPFAITGKTTAKEAVTEKRPKPNTQGLEQNNGTTAATVEQTPEQTQSPNTSAKGSTKTPGFEIASCIVCLLGVFLYKKR